MRLILWRSGKLLGRYYRIRGHEPEIWLLTYAKHIHTCNSNQEEVHLYILIMSRSYIQDTTMLPTDLLEHLSRNDIQK